MNNMSRFDFVVKRRPHTTRQGRVATLDSFLNGQRRRREEGISATEQQKEKERCAKENIATFYYFFSLRRRPAAIACGETRLAALYCQLVVYIISSSGDGEISLSFNDTQGQTKKVTSPSN